MHSSGTIAPKAHCHNRGGITGILLTLLAAATVSGCAGVKTSRLTEPAWELANADASVPSILARVRTNPNRPLPLRLMETLSPEFSLIAVTRAADWKELRGCLDLPPASARIDFSQGMVVGLLAKVGERAQPGWPFRMLQVRKHSGVGRIEAAFTPGLYYPIQTGGYLELAFVSDLRQVSVVCINNRTFLIQPRVAN